MAMDRNRVYVDVGRNLCESYTVFEQKLVELIKFARQQRLSVSSKILTTGALKIASELGIEGFYESNG